MLTLALPIAGLTSSIVGSALPALLITVGAVFSVLLTIQRGTLGLTIAMASVTVATDNDLGMTTSAVVETGGGANDTTSVCSTRTQANQSTCLLKPNSQY